MIDTIIDTKKEFFSIFDSLQNTKSVSIIEITIPKEK